MTRRSADDERLVQAFAAHETAVLANRAARVGVVTTALRIVDGWRDAGEAERRAFACRAQFAIWLHRQGRLSDAC